MDNQSFLNLAEYITGYCRSNSIKADEVSKLLDKCKIHVIEDLLQIKKGYYVLNKDGSIEPFSEEKLSKSIAAASDEIKKPLDESDIHNIIHEVQSKIKETGYKIATYRAVKRYTLNILKEFGFDDVYKSYGNFY